MRSKGLPLALASLATACGARSLVDAGETSGATSDLTSMAASTSSSSSSGVITDASADTSDVPHGTADPQLDAGVVLPDDMIWERRYDGETHNRDVGLCVATVDDDAIVVGGHEELNPFGSDSRSWLARLDRSGDVVWLAQDERRNDGAVAVTPSGRAFTAGRAHSIGQGTGWLMTTTAHTPDGAEQWTLGEPGEAAYGIAALGEDAIVVGMTDGASPTSWVARYDTDGEPVFSINGSPDTGGLAVTADDESIVVAIGEILGGTDVLGTTLSTFDATTGDPVGTPLYFDGMQTREISRDASGIVFLALGPRAMHVARVGEEGTVWYDTFGDNSQFQWEWGLAIDLAGNVVIAGSVSQPENVAQLRKYAPNGELLWTREYASGDEIQVNGVATTPNGDIIAVGEIRSEETDSDIWVSRWSP